jgi:hypothetical protein
MKVLGQHPCTGAELPSDTPGVVVVHEKQHEKQQ